MGMNQPLRFGTGPRVDDGRRGNRAGGVQSLNPDQMSTHTRSNDSSGDESASGWVRLVPDESVPRQPHRVVPELVSGAVPHSPHSGLPQQPAVVGVHFAMVESHMLDLLHGAGGWRVCCVNEQHTEGTQKMDIRA